MQWEGIHNGTSQQPHWAGGSSRRMGQGGVELSNPINSPAWGSMGIGLGAKSTFSNAGKVTLLLHLGHSTHPPAWGNGCGKCLLPALPPVTQGNHNGKMSQQSTGTRLGPRVKVGQCWPGEAWAAWAGAWEAGQPNCSNGWGSLCNQPTK